jgi:hypothetical protein
MQDLSSELVLPIVALAEAADIVSKARTKIPSVADLLTDVLADARIEIYPLTLSVFQQSLAAWSVPEMHDRLIVATAMQLEALRTPAALLTRDSRIVAAAIVTIIW